MPEVPCYSATCPEQESNVLSKIYFGWVSPLMATGYRRSLDTNDIWLVNSDRAVQKLAVDFKEAFQTQRSTQSNRRLLLVLYGTFKEDFWMGGVCLFLSSLGQVLVPFTLRYLLSFVADAYQAANENRNGPSLGRGIGILFGIVLIQLVQSLSTNHFLYRGAMVGAQARGVLTAAIFEKSFTISSRARAAGKGYSDGRIMNLVSTDVARIDLAAGMLHMLWAAPMTIIACLILLVINITYSAVAGFSLLVISIPALTIATKSLAKRRKTISTVADSRVSLTTEVLKSIRFVKYNAWEPSFLTKLKAFRKQETSLVAKLLTTRNAIYVISISTPIFAAMISFIVYSMTGHELGVGPVFSSLALFNAVRIPLSLFPIVIGQMADAITCLKRVEEFLLAEEHQEDVTWEVNGDIGIVAKKASFTWERTVDSQKDSMSTEKAKIDNDEKSASGSSMIRDLSLIVGRNELLAVVGTIGSGKTSLLSALAGELRKTSGELILGAYGRAFCAQQAWIQNSTVRNNILFGKPYHPRWYNTVVRACCLEPDFDQFPAGDETEIGERGANLSGGQKQRINIARAIYSGNDIVLLDDPLSALDAHVGRHVFDEAICGVLKSKCRVLATHQLNVLSRCDRILWLEDGRIKELDTFDNLMARSAGFRHMMANTTAHHKNSVIEPDRKTEKGGENPTDAMPITKNEVKLMKAESRSDGHIPWAVYRIYISSSGHILLGFLPILLLLLAQGANATMGLWLGFWTSDRFHLTRNKYIAIYVSLAVSQALLMFLFTASISNLGSISSRRTLNRATEKVLTSPQTWHDTQPLGSIVGRLSRDADVVDNQLPDALRMFLYTMVLIATVISMLIYYLPPFVVALVPILAFFLVTTSYFRTTARSLKKHEAALRSALFARFAESVSGVLTIRAYGQQDVFIRTVRNAIDDLNGAYYLTKATERWLAMRLDIVANAMVLSVGLLVVIRRDVLHPSISGVLLAYLLSMIHVIQLVVRQLADVQTSMVSMERLYEYTNLPTESGSKDSTPNDAKDVKEIQVPADWPTTGKFFIRSLTLSYAPSAAPALHDLSLTVRSSEKIGIVGRTGAGKSSLVHAFFRLVPFTSGSIALSGIDISSIPLPTLRNAISIIPQDPVLFTGSVRDNLDPEVIYSDFELNSALRKTSLLSPPHSLALDAPLHPSALSAGTAQLLTLARALLQDRRLVIMDEATSGMDHATDRAVQGVVGREFAEKTVVTIAHRVRSVLGCDRVVVMERGKVVEVGAVRELWLRGGRFRGMCEGNGILAEEILADEEEEDKASNRERII